MKKVLSIIVSYNFEPWIHKCIPSLQLSSYPTDILVIDNASKDKTITILQEQYPEVILFKSEKNLGFGKANNLGIEYAIANQYDFVFLINQDAWIDKDCITHIVNNAQRSIALYSPMHYDGTGLLLDKGFSTYTKGIHFNEPITKVHFVNAAFWFFSIELVKKTGLFSPIFYHYGEDKDFANRLNYHNIQTFVVPEALAYHDRQNRPESSTINFKGEFVYHLTELCNINYSWWQCIYRSIVASLWKGLQQLLKGNLHNSLEYTSITWKLLKKITEARQTRTHNKIIGNYFKS